MIESHTQNAFDESVKQLSKSQEKKSKKSNKTKPWIKKSWDYHSQYISELDVAPDWGDWESDWNMCWCCGHRGTLQQCHIIPKSLGGSLDPSNIIPLCGICHDKAPDVSDKNEMFAWVKENLTPLSGLGLGRYDHLNDILTTSLKNLKDEYGEINEEELYDLIRKNYEKTSPHAGQHKQGIFWKESTREWIVKKTFKEYKINREVEDWES